MTDITVSIRNLQHFQYCPHRWGLINIDCSWAENYFVTKADLMHKRVHDPDNNYSSRGRKILTSVAVYNDDLGLFGYTDSIELHEHPDGVPLNSGSEKYNLTIVEYKPKEPSNRLYNEDDVLQVFAQKVCVDSIFRCHCDGALYYGDTKKRVRLPLQENYDFYYSELISALAEMRRYMLQGEVPPIRKDQKCCGCSFRNICLPQVERDSGKQTFQRLLREAMATV